MPPVTDPRPVVTEKNVKDFSRQYLKEGMWPGKIKPSEYRESASKDRESLGQGNQILMCSGDKHETRIKPYQPVSTERAQFHKRGQLSTSRTIDIAPTTATSFYPNIDMNIVQKINSTLDNNYYQERKAGHPSASFSAAIDLSHGGHKPSLSSS
jgi:hypothetical protein